MSDNPYPYPSHWAVHYGVTNEGGDRNPSVTGIALLERAAHAAREAGELPPRVDAAIGQLGLIAMRIMSRPPSDSANDLVMLAGMLRE